MYDDLLGKPKKEKGSVIIQEIEWDDEKKKLSVTSETEVEVEVDEDGNINPLASDGGDPGYLTLYQRVMKHKGYKINADGSIGYKS